MIITVFWKLNHKGCPLFQKLKIMGAHISYQSKTFFCRKMWEMFCGIWWGYVQRVRTWWRAVAGCKYICLKVPNKNMEYKNYGIALNSLTFLDSYNLPWLLMIHWHLNWCQIFHKIRLSYMYFGLTIAPATFQYLLEHCLEELNVRAFQIFLQIITYPCLFLLFLLCKCLEYSLINS